MKRGLRSGAQWLESRDVVKVESNSYDIGRNGNAPASPLTSAFSLDTLMDNLFNL